MTRSNLESEKRDSAMTKRYEAILVGGHLGDSLGGPVETWSTAEIERHYGRIDDLIAATLYRSNDGTIIPSHQAANNWHAQQRPGEPSDDTILTLAVARSLVDYGYDLNAMAREHIAVIERRRKPDGSIAGGFGKTTLYAIERLAKGVSPHESGVIGIGNAPPMKMAPIGLYAHATRSYDVSLAFARAVGTMTHDHTPSIAAGVTQAHAIHELLNGSERHEFLEGIMRVTRAEEQRRKGEDAESLSERLTWVVEHQDADIEDALGTLHNDGRALCSYPFTIFMLQKHWDEPLTGLIATVNAGGDADTNASMYGALAAARHGRFWPDAWEKQLEEGSQCVMLARELAKRGRDL